MSAVWRHVVAILWGTSDYSGFAGGSMPLHALGTVNYVCFTDKKGIMDINDTAWIRTDVSLKVIM